MDCNDMSASLTIWGNFKSRGGSLIFMGGTKFFLGVVETIFSIFREVKIISRIFRRVKAFSSIFVGVRKKLTSF